LGSLVLIICIVGLFAFFPPSSGCYTWVTFTPVDLGSLVLIFY